MCGIIGYIGKKEATAELLRGLYALEYRGYDSSGVGVFDKSGEVVIKKKKGRISELEALLAASAGETAGATVGIGHTRWATHGAPNDANSHPLCGNCGTVTLVHNGIIENYVELREECIALGDEFTSETDTEVLAHIIEHEYEKNPTDPHAALRAAIARASGSYALCVLFAGIDDTIFTAKKDSPLLIGHGEGETYIASDITAFLDATRLYTPLLDGETAVIGRGEVTIFGADGEKIKRAPVEATWDSGSAQKGHFD